MNKLFKKTLILLPIIIILTAPVVAFAQDGEDLGPASFAGSITLWIAIVAGFIASLATLYFAFQLKGGVVGSTLNLFGAGMLFVVTGFLVVVIPWKAEDAAITAKIVHDVVFIIGYVLMLVGASRLRELT